MKIVFLEEVEGSGHIGDVKNVANGFARNYLLPRGLAAPPTEHYLAIARIKAEKDQKRQEKLDDEARERLLPKVEGRDLTLEVRVGQQGKLFGSVTARDVAELLQAESGLELEHRQVQLAQPIRDLGNYDVTVRLTRNIHVPVRLHVIPIGGVVQPDEEEEDEIYVADLEATPSEATAAAEPAAEAAESAAGIEASSEADESEAESEEDAEETAEDEPEEA
ncbi:MAG TPA: 50S ribosomal protein L9 [Dehalococcoidia bacterium]|nr:50S ribosomal protein L9 [Dehalococcoidia bacterium]